MDISPVSHSFCEFTPHAGPVRIFMVFPADPRLGLKIAGWAVDHCGNEYLPVHLTRQLSIRALKVAHHTRGLSGITFHLFHAARLPRALYERLDWVPFEIHTERPDCGAEYVLYSRRRLLL